MEGLRTHSENDLHEDWQFRAEGITHEVAVSCERFLRLAMMVLARLQV